MALSFEMNVGIKGLLSSSLDLSTVKDWLERTYSIQFDNGTGAGQANNIWHDKRTLTTGTNENLDLAGGVTNALGQTTTFTKIRLILFYGLEANTGLLSVSRPASNGLAFLKAAGDAFELHPDGLFILTNSTTAGITVTAGTGDLINVDNASGATQNYHVVIVGIS